MDNVTALDAYREGKLPLPPGHSLEYGADVLLLRREGGSVVAAFSAKGIRRPRRWNEPPGTTTDRAAGTRPESLGSSSNLEVYPRLAGYKILVGTGPSSRR